MTNRDELRKLAEAAVAHGESLSSPWGDVGELLDDLDSPDTEYILAADPQTILELLAEIDGLIFDRNTAYKLLHKNGLLEYGLIMAKQQSGK